MMKKILTVIPTDTGSFLTLSERLKNRNNTQVRHCEESSTKQSPALTRYYAQEIASSKTPRNDGKGVFRYIPSLIVLSLLTACGEGIVEIDKDVYEPKIVIEGFIYPNQPVRKIRITRNFPLNREINVSTIVLSEASVIITDENGTPYSMTYNPNSFSYDYLQNDLRIESGKNYTLHVAAEIDGVALKAQSTTTVPSAGLEVDESASTLGRMLYRERDANGDLKLFNLVFDRSPGTNFYALALIALDADTSTFVYENPFDTFTAQEVLNDFDTFKHRFSWIQDTQQQAGVSEIEVFWFDVWFYSDYQAILYAGDRNFKDFLVTSNDVQELDGNFHEPVLHIEGDGFGVFGSAVADTVHFTVTRE